jgi:hypothetical protein
MPLRTLGTKEEDGKTKINEASLMRVSFLFFILQGYGNWSKVVFSGVLFTVPKVKTDRH